MPHSDLDIWAVNFTFSLNATAHGVEILHGPQLDILVIREDEQDVWLGRLHQ